MVAAFAVKIPRRGVFAAAFDVDAPYASDARNVFEPAQDDTANTLSLVRTPHGKEQQVGSVVAITHDAEREERAVVADHRDVRVCVTDRMLHARRGPAPAQTLFDFVARHLRDAGGVGKSRETDGSFGDHWVGVTSLSKPSTCRNC